MPRVIQPGQFFVVGGPVQPDRACYIERDADALLLQGIADQQFCYVLSPRATGKSSLMAHTIRELRLAGQLAAVVDLTQIGSRVDSEDAGRWYYSIAYRILRELRIKTDLQTWWQDKSALFSEQRLVEFFLEIVLANAAEPVTIFVDEIERAADLPFAEKLFAAMRTCYSRRVSEPDFKRLNFVVLGTATTAQLCPDESLSPFVDGRPIELLDFTPEECQQLAAGFEQGAEGGRALIERIYAWTEGQPYLTQKLARGVARKGGGEDQVPRVVHELFLGPGISQAEPLLAHIRSLLLADTPVARQSLALFARIVDGRDVTGGPASPARARLRLTGVVRRDAGNKLRVRNEIYKRVFDADWVSSARPTNWRRYAGVAALVVAAVSLPYWYTQVLPRPYVDTLSVVTEDLAVATDAHAKLRALPGFGRTADRLMTAAMRRRSEQAQSFADVAAADAVLRTLPDRGALADELLGDYWLGRSADAAGAQRRDAALVLAMQAMPGRPVATAAAAADLIGRDYRQLTRSIRLAEAPIRWEVDWQRDEVVVIDAAHRVRHVPLGRSEDDGQAEPGATRLPGRLTALQHVPVTREVSVDADGLAGAFNLLLTLSHAKASDLLVTLTAPSGRQATLAVPQPRVDQQSFRFSARGDTPLAALADEERRGLWRLSIVDRYSEQVGSLLGWGLQYAGDGTVYSDEPEQGIALPDPARTDEVEVALSRDGRTALSWPTRAGAAGSLAFWDLIRGELVNDVELDETPGQVQFSATVDRAIVAGEDRLTIWDARRAEPVAEHTSRSGFIFPPALSVDGEHVAIAEESPFVRPTFSLLSAADGRVLSTIDGVADLRDWVLGPGAAYLAVLTPARQVEIRDPRTGQLRVLLRHSREIERIVGVGDAGTLITVDTAGDIHTWSLPQSETDAAHSTLVGATIDAASVSVAGNAAAIAFEASAGRVEVRSLGSLGAPYRFRLDGFEPSVATRIAPDARRLVTANGTLLRVWTLDGWPEGSNADLEVSTLAVDRNGTTAVLGFRGGHVQVRPLSETALSEPRAVTVDFIGHRGSVTSLAVDAAHALIASGGADGVVRLWDLTAVSPTEDYLRHPAGPIRDVEISADGARLISAAEYSARVWSVASREMIGEVNVNGAALAAAFAGDSRTVAVGDSAGNLFVGQPDAGAPLQSARATAAVRAVAFSPDDSLIATGDAGGGLRLWRADTAEATGVGHAFRYPVSAVHFDAAGRHLFVRSGHWLHRLELADDGLAVTQSRFVEAGLEAGALIGAPGAQRYLHLVNATALDFAMAYTETLEPIGPPAVPVDDGQLERDWPGILALALDPATGDIQIPR